MDEMTFVVTCMGRLDNLKAALPSMLAVAPVVLVDWSCPQKCGRYATGMPGAEVVSVPGMTRFSRPLACNAGGRAARSQWICFADADHVLSAGFPGVTPTTGSFYVAEGDEKGLGGLLLVEKIAWEKAGRYDESFVGYGAEDVCMRAQLSAAGLAMRKLPPSVVSHIPHGDDLRTRNYDEKDWRVSNSRNMRRIRERGL